MKKLFFNKVVWITGASSGIGEALAKEFSKEGAILALSARRTDRLEKLCSTLGGNAHSYPLDIRKNPDVKLVAKQIVKDHGHLDVAIANAGYGVRGSFTDLTEELWRSQFEVNLFGTIWTLQAAIPYLKKTKGRLAITSSVMGKLALGNNSAYSSSKFALMGVANSLYQELFPYGVSVTNLAPGVVESEISQVDNYGVWHEQSLNSAPRALMCPAQKAARDMLVAIYQRKREAVITSHGKILSFLANHMPDLTYWSMAKGGITGKLAKNNVLPKRFVRNS